MRSALIARSDAHDLRRRWRLAYLGYIGLAVLVVWWTWRALHDPASYDAGLAYRAGQAAWSTGHPEHVASWDGTPFLAAVMALLSRFLAVRATSDLVVVLGAAMWVGAVAMALRETHRLLSPVWWWIAALALLSFGPLMSTVWIKQFNAIALVLAGGGFELVRRRRIGSGAAAIGLSVALKPLVILLALVMLARRDTRRAGALAIAWVAGLNLAALVLLALRAHDLAILNPLASLGNFLGRSKPGFFACVPWNYSPGALFCRLAAYWPTTVQAAHQHASLQGVYQHAALQRVFVLGAVILLGAWVFDALRGRAATSWEVFAFTCVLSAMLSPLAWSHYQIMLAPLLLLLLVRFAREGASWGAWAGLAVAFALASLIWAPYGSIVGAIRGVVSGSRQGSQEPTFLDALAQFAQYVLVFTGVLWYAGRRRGTTERLPSV